LNRHGLRLHVDRLDSLERDVADAINDPRPLHANGQRRRTVKAAARDLDHALRHLERQLARMRAAA
jgi:hypothetical protein